MATPRDYLKSINFGRLEPSVDKVNANMVFSFSALGLASPKEVNVSLPLISELFDTYDQGSTNGCTGFSSSWMSSINNLSEYGIVEYDAPWLYHQGQEIDGDPATTPQADNGGYLWAVMDVLRKSGHVLLDGDSSKPSLDHGIESYYWCKSVDEIRTAFSLGRCPVLGINWYSGFMDVEKKDGEYWIGLGSNWGRIEGGHAIALRECFDSLDGFRLRNTWNRNYWGDKNGEAMILYSAIERLLRENGECAVAIDKKTILPPPETEKAYIDVSMTNISGDIKIGRLIEV